MQERESRSFVMLPQAIIEALPTLSRAEILVVTFLCSARDFKTNLVSVGQALIADRTGLSDERYVAEALVGLIAKGLIACERAAKRGRGGRAIYRIVYRAKAAAKAATTEKPVETPVRVDYKTRRKAGINKPQNPAQDRLFGDEKPGATPVLTETKTRRNDGLKRPENPALRRDVSESNTQSSDSTNRAEGSATPSFAGPKPKKAGGRVLTAEQERIRQAFQDWWCNSAYPARHHGVAYEFGGSRDAAGALKILRSKWVGWNLERCQILANYYLAAPDNYLANQGRPLHLLATQLQRWLNQAIAAQRGVRSVTHDQHRTKPTPEERGEFSQRVTVRRFGPAAPVAAEPGGGGSRAAAGGAAGSEVESRDSQAADALAGGRR